MIRLDRTATEPLHEQLYRQIRDELKSGRFGDGSSRLPSSRALATDRGISRSTVRLALSKLHAEGYLRSKPGSGTFVANLLPETFLTADQPKTYEPIRRPIRISDRVRTIPDGRVGDQFDLGATGAGGGVSLVPSIPAVDEFPMAAWERLRAQVLAKKGVNLLRYASNRGDADLRKAIAAYLCDFRAARCHPDQIVIVAGMQQAMLGQRIGNAESGSSRVDRRSLLSADPKGSCFGRHKDNSQAARQRRDCDCAIAKRNTAEDHLRDALSPISSRRYHEFAASNRLARFRACSQRIYFRG